MHIRYFSRIVIAGMTIVAAAAQQPVARQEPLAKGILSMSEADQIAYTHSDLDQGMPIDQNAPLGTLVLTRSSLVLPIIGKKIEEVLKSPNPLDCFTDKAVDPQRFVDLAASTIAYAGDEQALKEISKLIAIDEKRFGRLVAFTLINAEIYRNPFTVAYRGFYIGDPALDKRIGAWAELQFANKTDFRQGQLKHWWAAAMAEKYGAAPTEVHWANDPIATRLPPELAASLHDEILQLGREAFEKRAKK